MEKVKHCLVILCLLTILSGDYAIGKQNNIGIENNDFYNSISEKIDENIYFKAQDVVFMNKSNSNSTIFELKEYWAYRAIVDKDDKFYGSMQNLKKLVYYAFTWTNNDYRKYLKSIVSSVIEELLSTQPQREAVLSLINGFFCGDAIYCSIPYAATNPSIDTKYIYLQTLSKFVQVCTELGYNYLKIQYLVEELINRDGHTWISFKDYFEHDFNCYLEQFFMLSRGKNSKNEEISSVISQFKRSKELEVKNYRQEDNLKPIKMCTHRSRKNLNQNNKYDRKIIKGQEILDELEVTMGCTLEELSNNPILTDLEKKLLDKNTMVRSYEYISHPWVDAMDIWGVDEARQEILSRMQNQYEIVLNQRVDKRVHSREGISWIYFVGEDDVPDQERAEAANFLERINEFKNRVYPEEKKKLDNDIEELKKAQSDSVLSDARISIYIDWLFDRHPEYSLIIWRLSKVLNVILGFYDLSLLRDHNDILDTEKLFDSLCRYLNSSYGQNDAKLLKKMFKIDGDNNEPLVSPIIKIAIQCLQITHSSKILPEITELGDVYSKSLTDKESGNSSYGNFLYNLYVNGQRIEIPKECGGGTKIYGTARQDCSEEVARFIERVSKQINIVQKNKFPQFLYRLLKTAQLTIKTDWKEKIATYKDYTVSCDGDRLYRFTNAMLTAAISTLIRNLSFEGTYTKEYTLQLKKTFKAYKKYCQLNKIMPERICDFLKRNKIEWAKYIVNSDDFVNICLGQRKELQNKDVCDKYMKQLQELEIRYDKK